jgi:hypothetical protein
MNVFPDNWSCCEGEDVTRKSYQQRLRPERGAKSPRESERGWGPASS